MHTRPVVVLALSAATGAGLILARSHQRRARNGDAAAVGDAVPPAVDPRPEPQPAPFRIEARTVAAPRSEPARNGSRPSPPAPPAPLEPVELPSEGISSATLIAVAGALAVCAVALGAWAYGSRDRSSVASSDAVSVLSSPGAVRVPFTHSSGRLALVVEPDGRAVILVDALQQAPEGRAYQAWVVRRGDPARSAALFGGGERVVTLSLPVPRGGGVAVTVERSDGAAAPSRAAALVASRS